MNDPWFVIGQEYYAADSLATGNFEQWRGVQELNQRQASLRLKARWIQVVTGGPAGATRTGRAGRANPVGRSEAAANEERRISQVRLVMFGPKALLGHEPE